MEVQFDNLPEDIKSAESRIFGRESAIRIRTESADKLRGTAEKLSAAERGSYVGKTSPREAGETGERGREAREKLGGEVAA